MAILGWSGQSRHLANSRHRHLERARDGGSRHGENVHVGLELLECVLVLDTKTLFLVDDDESQVLELDVLTEKAVSSDHDIDSAIGEPGERLLGFFVRLESG